MLNLSSTLKTNKTQSSNARRSLLTASAILALTIPQITYAQDNPLVGPAPPPSIETNSPGGVDMSTGAFSTSGTDLAIGEGAFPNGLTLERSYNSQSVNEYSVFFSQGWSHNWMMRTTNTQHVSASVGTGLDNPLFDPATASYLDYYTQLLNSSYYHSVILSNNSAKFVNGRNRYDLFDDGYDYQLGTGLNVPGEYLQLEDHNRNQKLEYFAGPTGASDQTHNSGHFEFTDSDGTLYVFNSRDLGGAKLSHIIAPNGVRADVSYVGGGGYVKSVFTSNGYALLFDYSGATQGARSQTVKACVFNRADYNVSETSNCPAGVQTITYDYGRVLINWENRGVVNGGNSEVVRMLSATNSLDEKTRYEYDDGGHLACVKDPGQSTCRVETTYSKCMSIPPNGVAPTYKPEGLHTPEPVLSQRLATGEVYHYNFQQMERHCQGDPLRSLDRLESSYTNGDGSDGLTTRYLMQGGKPLEITDPLGRTTKIEYRGPPNPFAAQGTGRITAQISPEGQRQEINYDLRSNVIQSIARPKPGSSEQPLSTSAVIPEACTPTTRKTCNKPLSTTDANGNTTDYTYDLNHGGVTSVKGPAVNGVRPETRYSYVQRYARYKNVSGNVIQSPNAMWLLDNERSCTNSNMNANGTCAGGASQLVVTRYDYGPTTGVNNLLVRGTAVTSGGKTLRTCYGYDDYGRPTSETQPKGAGGSCS